MDETARRVRAARVYAGMTQEDMAGRLEMSPVTYKRIEGGRRELSLIELDRVAEITGWHRGLFSTDFDFHEGASGSRSAEQLQEVEKNLNDLVARLADIEWKTRQNVTGNP